MLNTVVTLVAGLAFARAATDYTETIHGSVIFSRHGERTPRMLSPDPVLTPLGAQQLYSSGSIFRARYAAPPSTFKASSITKSSPILGLSPYSVDNSQILIYSKESQHIISSAQAFLQGLYPPIGPLGNNSILTSMAILANGSVIDYPLNGYQYPAIETVQMTDPNYYWLSGDVNCRTYFNSGAQYYLTDDFVQTQVATKPFYDRIENEFLEGVISPESVGYYYSYNIWDYLNYGVVHNRTIVGNISTDELAELRGLASKTMFALNGNKTASGSVKGDMIRTIAGRSLASKVVGLLQSNIKSNGTSNKLNILFGDYQPFIAFFSLADLPNVNSNFFGFPNWGSTMVFELFSLDVAGSNTATYPTEDNLWVRFSFRNGTSDSEPLVAYSLFGRGRSQMDMQWSEFKTLMSHIEVQTVADWCNTCNSNSVFCPFYTNRGSGFVGSSSGSNEGDDGMTHQIAGVIGASVTLAFIGLGVAAAMLLFGFRFTRPQNKRNSQLGGFKGGQKLASDPDLTGGKVQAPAGAVKGHERVGSWELDNKHQEARFGGLGKTLNPQRSDGNLSVNPFSDPVQVEDRV